MEEQKEYVGLTWQIVGDQIGFPMTTKQILEMYAEEFGYCKLARLTHHDLTQFLTGWGINQADKLSREICGRFLVRDEDNKKVGPKLNFQMCYDDNRFQINQAIEHAIQKNGMGWDSNRQRLNFYEEVEDYLKKHMNIRVSCSSDQAKLVEVAKELVKWERKFHRTGGDSVLSLLEIVKNAEQALSEHGEG